MFTGKSLIQIIQETMSARRGKSAVPEVNVALDGGINSLVDRVETFNKASEIQFDKKLDPAMRPAARAFEFRTNNEVVQKRLDAIAAAREAVEKSKPPLGIAETAGAAAHETALLQMLRGMSDKDRLKAIKSDTAVALAAARAPTPILSGLTPSVHAEVKDAVRSHLYPEAMTSIRADFDALDAAADAVGMFRETSASLFRPQPITSIHDIPGG